MVKAYQNMQLKYLKENLTYKTIEEFLNTKYKATSKSNNKTFYDLLYFSQFDYFNQVTLQPVKFRFNNLRNFISLLSYARFESVDFNEELKIVDEKSKKVYNDVLTKNFTHPIIPDCKFYNFEEKEIGAWFVDGIIEEYPKGQHLKLIKWFDDVIVKSRKKAYFDLQVYKVLKEMPFDKCVINVIKTKDKYFLLDIDVDLEQIERSRLLGRLYYQSNQLFNKMFALPVIHRLTYSVKSDKIYLVKLSTKDKKIIKLKGL